ncbi:tRNA(Arg) A34 adenosine deaminase TadA [Thermoflavifilum aggregans]|uniref:tRNA(Arg) A34 adenosine deaminase TadA n=2 Tax=Thermoflavifilum aggregans TaxID=454188 RepID=A0A2M9CV87_9BACT|nr:tRNA(Arg) A34 adenosine deaminase TadA [Thermoflavifilum aggregans]
MIVLMETADIKFMKEAIACAREGLQKRAGGPFGAVIVKDQQIIARGYNRVLIDRDPTAHAEIVAIREACKKLHDFQLHGCDLYTTCEPCPMCLGAIYWARPNRIIFACTREDAARVQFDDAFIYEEIQKPLDKRAIPMLSLGRDEAITLFHQWEQMEDKIRY